MRLTRRSVFGLIAGALVAPSSLIEPAKRTWAQLRHHVSQSPVMNKANPNWAALVHELYPDSAAPITKILSRLKKPGTVEDPKFKFFEWGHSYPLQPPKRSRRLWSRGQRGEA